MQTMTFLTELNFKGKLLKLYLIWKLLFALYFKKEKRHLFRLIEKFLRPIFLRWLYQCNNGFIVKRCSTSLDSFVGDISMQYERRVFFRNKISGK